MLQTLSADSGVVTSVAATADGRMALSGSSDGTVKVWDLSISEDQGSTAGHQGQVNSVAVTTDGRLALSASSDRTLKVWDLVAGRELPDSHRARILGKVRGGDSRWPARPLGFVRRYGQSLGSHERKSATNPRQSCRRGDSVAVTPDARLALRLLGRQGWGLGPREWSLFADAWWPPRSSGRWPY